MNTDNLLKETTRRPWAVCGGATPKYIAIKHRTGYVIFSMADHTEHRECGKAISVPPFAQQRANARLIVRAVNAFELLRESAEKSKYHIGRLLRQQAHAAFPSRALEVYENYLKNDEVLPVLDTALKLADGDE